MDISLFSDRYQVKRLQESDVPEILALCEKNDLYYRYCPPSPTAESILADMKALPPHREASDKYYVGYYDSGKLIAVLDLILRYPDNETAYIGFFMTAAEVQNTGAGSAIIDELCSALASLGFTKIRLAWVCGNRQAEYFWRKCGFLRTVAVYNKEQYNVLEAEKSLLPYCARENMDGLDFITLRERPELMDAAADWFSSKWHVPKEAYLECMSAYLGGDTEYGWYLCLAGEQIAGGMGVIENDFHNRKDLAPNVCAVYTEEAFRGRGIAGKLLNIVVEDMRSKGISPVYLLTDHTGFYERYGWEFLCMVQGDGEDETSRMYVHW